MNSLPDDVRRTRAPIAECSRESTDPGRPGPFGDRWDYTVYASAADWSIRMDLPATPLPAGDDQVEGTEAEDAPPAQPSPVPDKPCRTPKELARYIITKYRLKRINSLIEARRTIRRTLEKLENIYPRGSHEVWSEPQELRMQFQSCSLDLMVHLSNLATEKGCSRPEDLRFIHQGNAYGVEFDPFENEYRPSCLPATAVVVIEGNR